MRSRIVITVAFSVAVLACLPGCLTSSISSTPYIAANQTVVKTIRDVAWQWRSGKSTLEAAGVAFLADGETTDGGPGVRLRGER